GAEVLETLHLAGEEAAPERAVGHEADAQLAARLEDAASPLGVAAPQRILALHGGDRVHRVRAAQRVGRAFGEAEVAHLARLHELRHRADRLLDRHGRIDAVLVVEIDRFEAEPLQAAVAGVAHIVGLARDTHRAPALAHEAELGREHDAVAPSARGEETADHRLVVAAAVRIGGIPEGHADLDRARERLLVLGLVGLAVELRHSHHAEADRRHAQSAGPECSRFHRFSSSGGSYCPRSATRKEAAMKAAVMRAYRLTLRSAARR